MLSKYITEYTDITKLEDNSFFFFHSQHESDFKNPIWSWLKVIVFIMVLPKYRSDKAYSASLDNHVGLFSMCTLLSAYTVWHRIYHITHIFADFFSYSANALFISWMNCSFKSVFGKSFYVSLVKFSFYIYCLKLSIFLHWNFNFV